MLIYIYNNLLYKLQINISFYFIIDFDNNIIILYKICNNLSEIFL